MLRSKEDKSKNPKDPYIRRSWSFYPVRSNSFIRARNCVNGPSTRRSRSPPTRPVSSDGTVHPSTLAATLTIIVRKDDSGYGMKVSGDNPVFVQSVRNGGAAERAGLHAGDTIIKVNGYDVTHSKHTQVVELIKSGPQVVLTVQHNTPLRERSISNAIASPSLQTRHLSLQAKDRVTAPQPVDVEAKRELREQKVKTLKLMLEKELSYRDNIRSALASSQAPDPKMQEDLLGAERRMEKLQNQLQLLTGGNDEGPGLPPPQHHRTKSSPESLSNNLAEASKRLIASESLSELSNLNKKPDAVWDLDSPTRVTPPGTPPPPYGGGHPHSDESFNLNNDDVDHRHQEAAPTDSAEASPLKSATVNFLAHGQQQTRIISMEDEDFSDSEQLIEDHGPFKSITKLIPHSAHLAVFLNYVVSSNCDPSSLLFYLVTDLYREGNAKEMKKWAYEIHSSFLVPCAPLRLSNVDENVAREIDDVLLKEADKEDLLRKVFLKARAKAKEELNEQLLDFQTKRTAGLGTIYGPSDSILEESLHDKNKELKIIESLLVPTLERYLDEIERDVVDDRRFTICAALGTVLAKLFGLRGPQFSPLIERCPTYVSKDKSIKSKLLGKARKVTLKGHHFLAHQYLTVTYCNHCHLIIWGIGPQGYQCSHCALNIHRNCVKVLDESCPGPLLKKEKELNRFKSKLMEKIRPENVRRKPTSNNLLHAERQRRLAEEEGLTDSELGERPGAVGRSEKRPDPVREAEEKIFRPQEPEEILLNELGPHVAKIKNKPNQTSINRSESYKERIHQKRQLRERRKTSDPNLSSKTNNDVDLDPIAHAFNATNSGSSSNSSLSTSQFFDRSLESPSNSLEGVSAIGHMWDSDIDVEVDPQDWTNTVPEHVLNQLSPQEKKRQEIINELFDTERSHVRGLKVLERIFYRPMKDQQIISADFLELLFSNLEEILSIHSMFNSLMKAKRKENPIVSGTGIILQTMFEGETFQKAAATFCARQQIGLEALKDKRKKDSRLQTFLNDAEMNPVCKRLQLKDILPTGWLRLTKYPLLLENLAKYTPKESEDYNMVKKAIERSKDILNHVDKAVKETMDKHRLLEIHRKLDKSPFEKSDHPISSEFKSLDLPKHRLIYEGALNWRLPNRQKSIDVHVLLLEEAIVILQRQDDKFILKYQTIPNYNQTLSPVIKVSSVLVRPNAVDNKALYLVDTSQSAQIYDLVTTSIIEKKAWFKHISDAAEAYKQKEKKEPSIPQDPELESTNSVHDKAKETDESIDGSTSEVLSQSGASGEQESSSSTTVSDQTPHPSPESSPHPDHESTSVHSSFSSNVGESVGKRGDHLRITVHDDLVEPEEVCVSQNEVGEAEKILTPLEKLKRKDEEISQALMEKQTLVADILHIPHSDYQTIAELAAEPSESKDPSELLLVAIDQANLLRLAMNEALRLTEAEAVSATSEISGVSPGSKLSKLPGVPTFKLQNIVAILNSHLSQLMVLWSEKEEERERLRKELQRCREQLHALHERQTHNGPTESTAEEESSSEPKSGEQTKDVATTPTNGFTAQSSEVFVESSGEVESLTEEKITLTEIEAD